MRKKMFSSIWGVFFPFLILAFLPFVSLARPEAQTTIDQVERISVGPGGIENNRGSFFSYTSYDNRYVTFHSWASNFGYPEGDHNWLDIFLRDRQADTTIRVTNGYDGSPTNEDSFDAVITNDGRYIVYTSYAWNLVPNDNNRTPWVRDGLDVFLYDTVTAKTERVSVTYSGIENNGNSFGTISPDGNIIYFVSNGSGIVPNSSTGGSINIYRRLRNSFNSVELITPSNPNGGIIGLSTSYDGRFIVFNSEATNLTPDDTNGKQDVFLYDYQTKQFTLISRPVTGGGSNGLSGQGLISQDGRFVIFRSHASNLVPGDTNNLPDIFVYDRLNGELERVSVNSAGEQANGDNRDPSICEDGRYVSYSSEATNLVTGDNNGVWDVFIHDQETGETFLASVNNSGAQSNARAHRSFLTADCRYITYANDGTNLVPNDTNDARDLFMARIVSPPDFAASIASLSQSAPGETTTFTAILRNAGADNGTGALVVPIPAELTLITASLPAGATFNSSENQVEWQGEVPGDGEVTIQFDLTIDAGLADFTIISTTAVLTGDDAVHQLRAQTAVNGMYTYFPLVVQQ